MKKIISVLAAAAITLTSAVTSFASGFSASIDTAAANTKGIDIIYNGQLMQYKDAVPEIINDRTMLPFRIALENMGATVSYDDASRLVTASLNGRTITFTLEDSVIYIDENGQKSQVTLDRPMIIKNDRTLVPIRFISSALGMQIGWDSATKTVLIVDADTYIKDFEKNAPNLMALADKTMPEYNTTSAEIALKLDAETGEDKINIGFGLKGDGKKADGVQSASGKLDLDLGGLVEGVEPIKDASAEIIMANGKLYFKTDAVEKLAKAAKDNETLALAAKTVAAGSWYSIDVNTLMDKVFADAETPSYVKDVYKEILNGDTSNLGKEDLLNIIKSAIASDGDATVESAQTADMVIDMYSVIDKYITVTDNSVSVKIDKNAFSEIMKATGVSDAELKEMTDMMTVNIDVTSTFDEKKSESKGTISMGINADGIKMNLSMDISSTEKAEENVKPAEVPANAVDITSAITAALQ